jgi:hypothetical protein
MVALRVICIIWITFGSAVVADLDETLLGPRLIAPAIRDLMEYRRSPGADIGAGCLAEPHKWWISDAAPITTACLASVEVHLGGSPVKVDRGLVSPSDFP